jgi:hypothetical protein
MRLFTSNFNSGKKFSIARTLLFSALLVSSLWLLSDLWVRHVIMISERINDIRNGALQKAEAISLGNSHSVAIDFETLGLSHVALWTPGGELFEARVILEQAYAHGARPKWLFLTLNPFILLQDNGHSINLSNSSMMQNIGREHAYLILRELSGPKLIRNDFVGWLRAMFIPLRKEGNQSYSILSYFKCTITPTDNCMHPRFRFPQEIEPINPDSHPYYRFPILLSLVSPALKENSTIIQDSIEELHKIQQLALEHDTHFVLLEAPLAESYVNGMLEELKKADPNKVQRAVMQRQRAVLVDVPLMHGYIGKLLGGHESLDSSTRQIPAPFDVQKKTMSDLAATNDCVIQPGILWVHEEDGRHVEWFADLLHLNEKGSIVFTSRLKDYLEKTSCKIIK